MVTDQRFIQWVSTTAQTAAQQCGLTQQQACQLSHLLSSQIKLSWGGQRVYIHSPSDDNRAEIVNKIRELHHKDGMSFSQIATKLKLHYSTVRRVLQAH